MADYINREDAVRILCRETCHPGAFCPDSYCVEMWDKLSEIPSADVPQWIPCSERRPESKCLACDESGELFIPHNMFFTEHECYEAIDLHVDKSLYSKFDYIPRGGIYVVPRKIVAWMPLPEPYKGGKQND